MNFEEIIEKLNDLGIYSEHLGHSDYKRKEVESLIGKFELVDEHGGYEGDGEECHRVYHAVDHDVYIRVDGYYMSYHGSDWESDPYEVRPHQRMITVYE